jgi:predicted nuclease of predicted toxin-antitoxin system
MAEQNLDQTSVNTELESSQKTKQPSELHLSTQPPTVPVYNDIDLTKFIDANEDDESKREYISVAQTGADDTLIMDEVPSNWVIVNDLKNVDAAIQKMATKVKNKSMSKDVLTPSFKVINKKERYVILNSSHKDTQEILYLLVAKLCMLTNTKLCLVEAETNESISMDLDSNEGKFLTGMLFHLSDNDFKRMKGSTSWIETGCKAAHFARVNGAIRELELEKIQRLNNPWFNNDPTVKSTNIEKRYLIYKMLMSALPQNGLRYGKIITRLLNDLSIYAYNPADIRKSIISSIIPFKDYVARFVISSTDKTSKSRKNRNKKTNVLKPTKPKASDLLTNFEWKLVDEFLSYAFPSVQDSAEHWIDYALDETLKFRLKELNLAYNRRMQLKQKFAKLTTLRLQDIRKTDNGNNYLRKANVAAGHLSALYEKGNAIEQFVSHFINSFKVTQVNEWIKATWATKLPATEFLIGYLKNLVTQNSDVEDDQKIDADELILLQTSEVNKTIMTELDSQYRELMKLIRSSKRVLRTNKVPTRNLNRIAAVVTKLRVNLNKIEEVSYEAMGRHWKDGSPWFIKHDPALARELCRSVKNGLHAWLGKEDISKIIYSDFKGLSLIFITELGNLLKGS